MADLINRVGSPMDICEESLDESPDKIEKRKKLLALKQRTRSPFLIGSIEAVNKKISSLDRKLQGYTQLVCESRAASHADLADLFPASAMGRDRYHQRERETKEVNCFAGIYTLKSTLVPGLSQRVKHISKISMQPSKTTISAKKETGKPKFVELHQYPGYDPTELTPLPDGIAAADMLKNAAEASMGLDHKPHFKPEFDHLFYSQMSQAVLQDLFWYYFLEKFQSSRNSQVKLFNRIAHNYVKLTIYAKNPVYRDTFLKGYPMLMCQAVYSAFCHAFPDSYRQFGEVFKDDLVALIMEWMTGLPLAPRVWLGWNMDHLEPANIKMREEILSQKNKKSSTAINFDFLDSLVSSVPSQYTSNTSLNQSGSRSSLSSNWTQKKYVPRIPRARKSTQSLSRKVSTLKVVSPASSQDSHVIDTVADAQISPRKQSQKLLDPRKLLEALTPIREMTGEDEEPHTDIEDKKLSQMSASAAKEVSHSRDTAVKVESHPACRGPDFVRSAFNISGHSPLVAHFMRMKKLTTEAGVNFRVQRTEIENLPALDTPTYRDVIRTSLKTIKDIEQQFSQMYTRSMRENAVFVKKQNAIMREHMQKESALLSRTKEVKRLSDLLILEQRKGEDSISAGADAAIEAALMAQE
ncbi:protein FAM227B-like [Haliotis rubra]|uniref:protein FAM227B-like n=1 Tax=Haliotis rubra TaxID=36100 RepID=UPI001EE5C0E2|nr:protein FAM227B-like [Haliotis rubra]